MRGGYGKKDLREWIVTTVDGKTHTITAHFCFDNAGEGSGLIFRAYETKGDEHTYVVAAFANGQWANFKEIK